MTNSVTLSVVQVTQFLHHLHVIPLSHGLTRSWIAQNAPGWTTGPLLRALADAGAIEPCGVERRHHSGWVPIDDLIEVTVPGTPALRSTGATPVAGFELVRGRRYCRTCGVPFAAVHHLSGTVACAEHASLDSASDVRYDWRTGVPL